MASRGIKGDGSRVWEGDGSGEKWRRVAPWEAGGVGQERQANMRLLVYVDPHVSHSKQQTELVANWQLAKLGERSQGEICGNYFLQALF